MKSREILLAEAPINKLLWKLSLPAMVGMFVIAFYNIVDTIFIGRGIGVDAIAGIAVFFPLYMIVMAFSMIFGIGGSSLISRKLGERKKEEAENILAHIILLVFSSSIIITIIGILFIEPIMKIFGANNEILPLAVEYGRTIFFGVVFFSFSIALSNIIRAEGEAKRVMFSMIIASLINIVFDYLFIFKFNLGLKGAALATVISNIFSGVFLFSFYLSKKSILKIKFHNFKINTKYVKEIFGIGISSFARQASGSFSAVIINNLLGLYGASIAIAAYGIIQRLVAFVAMPIFGIVQGMQPIVGFNYGAGDIKRVIKTIKSSIFYSTVLASFAFIIFLLFSHQMIMIFSSDPELIEIGDRALKIIFLLFPLAGLQMVSSGMYQALGRTKPAFFISILRQFLVLIPAILILSRFFALDGIWFGFLVTEIISFIICFYFYKREMNLIKNRFELGDNVENVKVSV